MTLPSGQVLPLRCKNARVFLIRKRRALLHIETPIASGQLYHNSSRALGFCVRPGAPFKCAAICSRRAASWQQRLQMGAPDAVASLSTGDLRRLGLELRALLIAAQRTRRGALIAALAPLAPLRNLADASDVGEDVAAPTETEWLDAVECMAEPLCVELARTLEDATTLILSLERAEGLQAALDAQHEQKLAEHEERMSGGGGDAEVDAED